MNVIDGSASGIGGSASGQSLTHRILSLIDEGEFGVGERLGSERSLSEQFGVGRPELRRALEELERGGRIRRTMGRAGGVFVFDGKIDRHLNTVTGVPDVLRQQGFSPTTRVMRSELGHASALEARTLALPHGAGVYRLIRRRDADGVPLSLDSMSMPASRFTAFQQHDLTSSVYGILREHYGVEISHANETIDVVSADAGAAQALSIDEGAPLLEIRRVTYDVDDRPFEYARDLFRADRTRISMQRLGARWKRVGRAT